MPPTDSKAGNKNPISEEERETLRAEHRERVRRCEIALKQRYNDEQRAADEEEYARMENEGG